MKTNWRPFEEARAFVRSLGLPGDRAWKAYCASGQKPADIPSSPRDTYRGQFTSTGDWLGTGTVANRKREFLPFEEARAFARALGLGNQQAWLDYCKSGQRPAHIPANPEKVYRGQFQNLSDWLGTDNAAPNFFNREFLPFEEARAFARALGLQSTRAWQTCCKSGQRPDTIPASPWPFYRGQFTTIGDWLGTGTTTPRKREFLPFEEARAFARSLGLGSQQAWLGY